MSEQTKAAIMRLWRRWVGCDRCRTRADHRAVVALNRRLVAAVDDGRSDS